MSTAPAPDPGTTSTRGLLVGLVLGTPIIAYGVGGALVDADRTRPAELARWVVGAAVVNDLVLIPVALVVGWGARRLIPASVWPIVRAGLLTTGVLVLVAWPFVRGYGVDPANPSLFPRDYGAGLLRAVAVVWTVALVGAAVTSMARARRRRRAAPGGRRADRRP
jgi:hypothetical protein